jgi:hypothetical protein
VGQKFVENSAPYKGMLTIKDRRSLSPSHYHAR